eukprot:14169497-Alexandrium_andersonii.AAC.1
MCIRDRVTFRAQLDAADAPPAASGAGTPIPEEPPLLLSPTYDPPAGTEEQGRRMAGFLAEVTRTANTLLERQSAFAGRLVG